MGIYQDALTTAGSKAAAARSLGLAVATYKDRLNKELSGAMPEIKNKPAENKLKLYGISEVAAPKTDKPISVLFFTDAHNHKDLSLDRFKWLARFIDDQGPDALVDGGDFDDMPSVCFHDRDETAKGKLKPTIGIDLEMSAKARKVIDSATHKCRKIITLGNHEQRLWRYEDANPAVYGMATNLYMDIQKSFGYEVYDYGSYVDIGGVDFIHVPFNGRNEMGGMNLSANAAKLSCRDKVYGHTHNLGMFIHPKTDLKRGVMSFNGGSFMPEGYVGEYAKKNATAYWYGAHILTIKDGGIASIKSWHMSELRELYGH